MFSSQGNNASALSRFLGIYEAKNAGSWRQQDVNYMENEKQHRLDGIQRRLEWRREDIERKRRIHKLANERRLVDSRSWQLRSISQMCLLITIFGRQAYVESHLPENTSNALSFVQGTFAALGMLFLLLCMLRSFMLIVSTLNYASYELEDELKLVTMEHIDIFSPFNEWWKYRCEDYWIGTYRYFRWGVFFVIVALTLTNSAMYAWGCYGVAPLAGLTLFFWLWRIEGKWGNVMDCSPEQELSATHQQL